MKILVSACLLGVKCRYDGGCQTDENVLKLAEKHELIPVCPELFGGLGFPRPPVEIRDDGAVTRDETDVTEAFTLGAEETLRLARLLGCRCAVMKERSPSCGFGEIYDGTFSDRLTKGSGLTAALLDKNGIRVIGESDLSALDE